MTTQSSEAAMRVAREIWKLVPEWSIRGMWNIDGAVETLAQIIDREAVALEGGFVQHYIDALETQITTSEARNAELVTALITIRGWREIGHAVTLGERLQAVEDIAHQALVKHEREKTK